MSRGLKVGLAAAVLLAVGGALLYAHHQRGLRRRAELARDSLEAAADTTRLELHAWRDAAGRVRDYYQRRAVQAEIQRDAVAEELAQESRARAELELTVATRDTAGLPSPGPVTVDTAGVREASITWRREPFTVDVRARVPPPPDSARWDISAALDALHMDLRVACGEAPAGREVRPANVTVGAPAWATVRLDSVRTAAHVCNPEPGGLLFGWDPPTWLQVAVPFGAGLEAGRRLF